MGKMLKMDGISGKIHIFLDNIGHSFETSGRLLLRNLTLCAKSYLEVMY